MKFGHNLPRNQVPEWASSYINYKGLKKLIKTASEAVRNGEDADLAAFFFTLDRNLEDVDGFYNKKYAEYARRLRLLHGRYGRLGQSSEEMDKDEAQDLMGALLELRSQMRQLQWYGEVNRRGFVKITKKLDKKVAGASTQQRYLMSKVTPRQFAHNLPLNQDLKAVNEWLSGLGEIKTFDDTGSSHSASSLGRVPGRSLNLAAGVLDGVDTAIRNDDAEALAQFMANIAASNDRSSASFQQTLLNFLQRAISCRAKACIANLLLEVDSLEENDDMHKRNCLHRLIINVGRAGSGDLLSAEGTTSQSSTKPNFITPATAPVGLRSVIRTTEEESSLLLSKNDESVRLLLYLLDHLQPRQRSSLQSRDAHGRLPLHYAAQYGFVILCKVIIERMQAWGQFDVSQGIDSQSWQDEEGHAPLHLAVIGGHALTTKALLQAEHWNGEDGQGSRSRSALSQSGAALILATQSNFVPIVQLLVDAGIDINHQNEQGETALHIAAQSGHDLCAQALLEGSASHKANLEITEITYAWTPLSVACVSGHASTAVLLARAGARIDTCDNSGYTAREHAALRGHMDVVEELAAFEPTLTSQQMSPTAPSTHASSLQARRAKSSSKENGNAYQKPPEPVKTFGHRYLTKETMVLVSLGSMDTRKEVPAVKLDDIPLADAHATQLDTALSVVVSATGATGEPSVVDLPVQENICTEPVTFMTTDVSKVKLLFDIVPTYAGTNDRKIGRGVALLSTIKTSIGSNRIPLQGDVNVPIIAATTLDVIGTVNFNFLVITPFSHPNLSITEQHTYWKKMTSTMVIGHRGLGKNTGSRSSLQLGENTIQSFIAAANLGASYVEFDVQLTKDHVPVIYHDFLVSETGIDAPVHTLTLEQFLHVGEGQGPRQSGPASPQGIGAEHSNGAVMPSRRPRSYSLDNSSDKIQRASHSIELTERMKHTRDFKKKGYKGNSRGNSIQAPFTTLEEMFHKLPESTGFNIEMKYPMLHESVEQEMDQYAVELNSFVDTVLKMVYDFSGKRNIMFSSFNPDICLMLSFKQPSIPVLFLTDAGTSPVGDVRAASLQEAIRFASRWNLLGIVSASEPFVHCPRLVRVVKQSGLVCVSYGTQNNDPENVKLQEREGIDAVIVDNVLAVRKGLTAPAVESGLAAPAASSGPVPDSSVSTSDAAASKVAGGSNAVAVSG